jgi:hypothetical protein
VAAHGWNLATRSPAERAAVHADLIACRLRHYQREKGKAWRQWVQHELAMLPNAQAVREALNRRMAGRP